MVSYT
ncbi:UNVERIFIED_CONTAM: hypothetical protein GTU68_005423 [Idotea baltica]